MSSDSLFHYKQPDDPGAVGAGRYWLDDSDSGLLSIKRRNEANDGWIIVGGGNATDDYTFTDSSPGSTPVTTTSRLYVGRGTPDLQVPIWHTDDGHRYNVVGDSVVIVRNVSGATIEKGSVVHHVGVSSSTPTVEKAKADDASTSRVFGVITDNDIVDGGYGLCVQHGIASFDTSALTGLQYLSASSAGVLTPTAPTAPDVTVVVGRVMSIGTSGDFFVDVHLDERLLLTTKGDLLTHSGSGPVRQPVGADGRVLVADSGVSTGIRWAMPGASTQVSRLISGRYYDPGSFGACTYSGSLAQTANTLYGIPLGLDSPLTIEKIGIVVNANPDAARKCRVGIYLHDPIDAQPGALVIDAGEFVLSTDGLFEATINQFLDWGVEEYWLGFVTNSAVVTFKGITGWASGNLLGTTLPSTSLPAAVAQQIQTRVFTYGDLPDPWGVPTTRVTSGPRIYFKVA